MAEGGIKVSDLFAKLGIEVDEHQWEKAEHNISHVGSSLGGLAKIGTATAAAIAAVGIGLAYAIGEWFEGVSEKADKFSKEAQKLGIGTENLQQLAYAAELSDVSLEGLSHAIGHYSRSLNEAMTKGTGPVVDAFRQLHISMNQIKGETVDQNLEVIADAFAKMPDGAKKTALAMELFGRSGKELIPLLNGGKKELVELRNEAAELGIVVDGKTAKAFEKFNDDAKRVKTAWEGVKTQIAVALLPHLQRAIDVVLNWVKANREIIQQRLEETIEKVTEYATDLYNFIKENWPTIKTLFKDWGKEILDTAKAIADIVRAISFLIEGLKQIKTWLQPVFDWLEDKLKKIGEAIGFVIDKIPGLGGGGGDDDGVKGTLKKGGKWLGKKAVLGPLEGVETIWNHVFSDNAPKSEGIPGLTGEPTIGAGSTPPGPSLFGEGAGGNSFTAQITVNPSPGMNEKDLADKTVKMFDEFWDAKMREAHGDLL